ncbi:MAG TPA: hypothetical protein VK497_02495 [Candidatus Saccharimonadales bacterium]|nr:hypothetical protein [Candidatus Saccharimonadales bacterium]
MNIRTYQPSDYKSLRALYENSSLYGGQFDEARDGEERLRKKIEADSDAILLAEDDASLIGTVSLIDDGRVAWLFRFAVAGNDKTVVAELINKALGILKERGHTQVLVYSPVGESELDSRYEQLGFNKGGDYTCYWKDIV